MRGPQQGYSAFVDVGRLVRVVVEYFQADRVVEIIPVDVALVGHAALAGCHVLAHVFHV